MVDNRSEYAQLAGVYLPVAVVVFALVAIAVAFALIRFRAREGEHTPAPPSESRLIEPAYAVVLVAVVAVLIVLTYRTETKVDAVAARPALTVRVLAAQWTWTFTYPGTGVVQRTGTRDGQLVLPAGRTVHFEGSSLDVIHDFWVPASRFQRQLFPDHVERWDLTFAKPGVDDGTCAMFCGLYHDQMAFTVRVLAPAAFDAWLARRRGSAA